MTKKPVFLLDNPTYQYDQMKGLIEYMGCDVFFLHNRSTMKRVEMNLFDKDLNPITLDDIPEGKYSAAIINSSVTIQDQFDISIKTDLKKYIRFSHSIIGLDVDVVAAIPARKQFIGVYPKCWENLNWITERVEKYKEKTPSYSCQTHPIMTQILSQKPKLDVEPNTLGIVLNTMTSESCVLSKVKDIVNEFDKIYVKNHPLSSLKLKRLQELSPNIEIFDCESDKYDFTDRCEYLMCGSSSLTIEAILRSKLYKRNQGIYCFDNPLGRKGLHCVTKIPGMVRIEQFEKGVKPSCSMFDDLLEINNVDSVYKCLSDLIFNIISTNNLEK